VNKDEYIKKLELRIHNQRVALRENWMITETRMKHRPTYLRSMWWDKVKGLIRENKELKKTMNKNRLQKLYDNAPPGKTKEWFQSMLDEFNGDPLFEAEGRILELEEQVNMLIDFAEGWKMPLGWNQIVGQIRGDIKKF